MRRSILILACSVLGFGLLSQAHAGEIKVINAAGFEKSCVKPDSEPLAIGDFGDHISFGPSVAAQVLRYDLASKKAAFNTGIGAGFSMRWYNKTDIKTDTGEQHSYGISKIRSGCRATTFEAAFNTSEENKFQVGPLFAISPFVYLSKVEATSELNIQPAIQVSFLSDLLTVGTGFNLTGTDKGHAFLLLSLGWGFKL